MTSDNNWIDPLYLNELLTDEEKSIKNTAKNSSNIMTKLKLYMLLNNKKSKKIKEV